MAANDRKNPNTTFLSEPPSACSEIVATLIFFALIGIGISACVILGALAASA